MPGYFVRRHRWLVLGGLAILMAAPAVIIADDEKTHGLDLHDTRYYRLYSNAEREVVLELAARMTRMFEEYARRSKNFSGKSARKLPVYFFDTQRDYHLGGGPANSGGCFSPRKGLMIPAERSPKRLAHVMQHEAFHQFAHHVISDDMPTWVNEGLATYFQRAIWTGDGFVTGIVPAADRADILAMIEDNEMIPFARMVRMSSRQWSRAMADPKSHNYDQVWSMTHFLIHADDGRYMKVLDRYLINIHKGQLSKAEAFMTGVKGLQEDYVRWWQEMSLDESHRRECEAVVATLTGFLARAETLEQEFETPSAFLTTYVNGELKIPSSKSMQWLPESLLVDALRRLDRLTAPDSGDLRPVEWRIERGRRGPGKLVLITDNNTCFIGEPKIKSRKVADVDVTIRKATPADTADASPVDLRGVLGRIYAEVDKIHFVVEGYTIILDGDWGGKIFESRRLNRRIPVPSPTDAGRVTVINPYDYSRVNIPEKWLGKMVKADDGREFLAKRPGGPDTVEEGGD